MSHTEHEHLGEHRMTWTPVDLGTIAGILDDLAVPPFDSGPAAAGQAAEYA